MLQTSAAVHPNTLRIGRFTVDWKAVFGVALAALGWVATNGATIVPTLPESARSIAGGVITAVGIILTFLGHAPYLAPKPPLEPPAVTPTITVAKF